MELPFSDRVIARALVLALCLGCGPAAADESWWDPAWDFRVAVDVDAAGVARVDKPVEVVLDFTALLSTLGQSGALNTDSLRVVDSDSHNVMAFQFDPDPDFDAATRARGEVVFLAEGQLAPGETRRFHVYFAVDGSFDPPVVTPRVGITDGVMHEQMESYVITSQNATWYYQKQAAGFASLHDADDIDWIGYTPGGGSAGEYRGIPNLGEWAHPGYTNATSRILHQGPVRISIQSETTDQAWEDVWHIFPAYARLTLTRSGGSYWFLYEGTPGGALDANDYCVRSPGTQTDIGTDWHQDLPDPEWAYFGDAALGRILFLVHHEDDAHSDQFWQMQNNMTVFGFGREYTCCDRYMTAAPAHFTVGLAEAGSIPEATAALDAAYRPLAVTVQAPESQGVQPDGGVDAGADAGQDAGGDPGQDAGGDPGQDAGSDPSQDAGGDPGQDAGSDPGADPFGDMADDGSSQEDAGEDGSDSVADQGESGDEQGGPTTVSGGCGCGAQPGGSFGAGLLVLFFAFRKRQN